MKQMLELEGLFHIELDDLGVKHLAVMKRHALAQGHVEGAVVEPLPSCGQAQHQLPILVDLQEMLEDVKHNRRKVRIVCIDNAQFPPRRRDLLPKATMIPFQSHEHEDNATQQELMHDRPSLSSCCSPDNSAEEVVNCAAPV